MIFLQDTLFGFDYAKEVFSNVPTSQGLGVFLELDIGKGYDFAEEAGRRGYVLFRAHPMWKDRHDFKMSDLPEIVRRARLYNSIAEKYSGTKWYLSTGCEHKLDAKTARHFFDVLKYAAPHCTIVNCPLPQGATVPETINEVHGEARARTPLYAYSSDGDSIVDMDITELKRTFKGAEYFGCWDAQYNKRAESDDITLRPKRKIKPSGKLIKSMVLLAGDKGETHPPAGWICKSHAEKQLKPDPRADKLCYIAPKKFAKIELRRGDKLLATLRYHSPYSGGGYRYYSTVMGFEVATNVVNIYIEGEKVGTVNPTFRDGKFR